MYTTTLRNKPIRIQMLKIVIVICCLKCFGHDSYGTSLDLTFANRCCVYSSLLGYEALSVGKQLSKFRNNIVPSSSGHAAQVIGAPTKPLQLPIRRKGVIQVSHSLPNPAFL